MNFQQIAKIKKPFGNKGELIIIPASSFQLPTPYSLLPTLQNNQWLFIDIDGDIVPFMIENIQHRSDETSLIKLKDISIEKANKYTGLSIYLPTKNPIKNTYDLRLTTYDLLGYTVIDKQKGEIGIVKNIIKKHLQDLLEINYLNKQILIPVDKNIIKKIDAKYKTIHINAPDGLIDLYL